MLDEYNCDECDGLLLLLFRLVDEKDEMLGTDEKEDGTEIHDEGEALVLLRLKLELDVDNAGETDCVDVL